MQTFTDEERRAAAARVQQTLDAKYAVFPYGNTNPTALDKRIVALLREVDQIRLDIQTAAPNDPEMNMHVNLGSALSNLGVDTQWLLRDHWAYLARNAAAASAVDATPA